MNHILTLVVDRASTTLTDAIIARVREAIQGWEAVPLSPGEATKPVSISGNNSWVRRPQIWATVVSGRNGGTPMPEMACLYAGSFLRRMSDCSGWVRVSR